MKLKGLKIYSRSEWGARYGRGGQTSYANATVFVHHSAFAGMATDTYREQVAVMKAIEHHHVKGNGWDAIGYNFVVFQPFKRRLWHRARIFEGRGLGHLPAAQQGHNAGNIAVCVIGNFQSEGVRAGTVDKLVSLIRRLPVTKVRGHRDVNQTSCPGLHLFGKLGEIRRRTGKD